MRPASVVSSVELETRKISEGKIIYILGPYADVRVYVCHMFVYLFVCSLGIAPFPLRFSLTCTLFLSARRGQQLWNTEEYPPDTELCSPNFLIRAALFPDGNAHSVWESVFRHFLAPSVYLLRCSRFSRFLIPLLDECEII